MAHGMGWLDGDRAAGEVGWWAREVECRSWDAGKGRREDSLVRLGRLLRRRFRP